MLRFQDLVTLYPEQTWLELSSLDQHSARQQLASQTYSNLAARERAYHHLLCLPTIATFLQAELDPSSTPTPWLASEELPSIWEVANGCVLLVGNLRFAIIPTEVSRFEELRVEQEWIDLPDWAAHYYIAVQLNVEEDWLRIWGYATHPQLKYQGTLDALDRSYSLDRTALIRDFNALRTTLRLFPVDPPMVAPLPALPSSTAAQFIHQLSQPSLYSPRLELPFTQWAPLIAQPEWRKQLYDQRLHSSSPAAAATRCATPTRQKLHLSQWASQGWAAGWQAVSELFDEADYAIARGTEQQAKPLELGNHTVALIVGREPVDAITLPPPTEVGIVLEARVLGKAAPLPAKLRLSVSFHDETGNNDTIEQEIRAHSRDSAIQLPRLLGKPGEEFSVTLTLGEFSVTEEFVV